MWCDWMKYLCDFNSNLSFRLDFPKEPLSFHLTLGYISTCIYKQKPPFQYKRLSIRHFPSKPAGGLSWVEVEAGAGTRPCELFSLLDIHHHTTEFVYQKKKKKSCCGFFAKNREVSSLSETTKVVSIQTVFQTQEWCIYLAQKWETLVSSSSSPWFSTALLWTVFQTQKWETGVSFSSSPWLSAALPHLPGWPSSTRGWLILIAVLVLVIANVTIINILLIIIDIVAIFIFIVNYILILGRTSTRRWEKSGLARCDINIRYTVLSKIW